MKKGKQKVKAKEPASVTCAACGDFGNGRREMKEADGRTSNLRCCQDCLRLKPWKFEAAVSELRFINQEHRKLLKDAPAHA